MACLRVAVWRHGGRLGRAGLRLGQRLLEIPENVLEVLDPDRDPDQLGPDPGRAQLLVVELLVRRRAWMDDQRLRVAHVGYVREELHRLDAPLPRLPTALDAECEDRAGALGQVLLGQLVVAVRP